MNIVEEYYKKANVPAFLLKSKMDKLNCYPDILNEFGHWIQTGKYLPEDISVSAEGYTAQKLADLSPLLDGEGAFMILIELHENPQKAKDRIAAGFTIK